MNKWIGLCLISVTMATACTSPIAANPMKTGLQNTVQGNPKFVQVAPNPVQVTIVKNASTTTVTNPAQLSALVRAVNALANQQIPGQVHCMAMTADHYTLTFHYKDGSIRSFHNHGGGCQPLVDDQSGIRLQSFGAVLTVINPLLSQTRNP
ncbi:hypothetical protein [Alicyclobacillus pomorum]|uniref:hypothetical protein n=1 Tax=Alicyclobacillus pomorum TaxID=204470 RepID=UPI0004230CB2|nr:hypothetical protein [Alicyclobacillus pomorum]